MQYSSKCDMIVNDILSKVVNRVYPAGQQLPIEADLCEEYNASRVTIRESLKKLQAMGVVSIKQGKGSYVKEVGLGYFMKPMFNLINFDAFDVTSIYDARLYIEIGTCRLAALNRTAEDLEALESRLNAIGHYVGIEGEEGIRQLREADKAFHIQVASAAHNEILKAVVVNMETISDACAKRLHIESTQVADVYGEHFRIYEAILAGDPEAAEKAIAEHTANSKKCLDENAHF